MSRTQRLAVVLVLNLALVAGLVTVGVTAPFARGSCGRQRLSPRCRWGRCGPPGDPPVITPGQPSTAGGLPECDKRGRSGQWRMAAGARTARRQRSDRAAHRRHAAGGWPAGARSERHCGPGDDCRCPRPSRGQRRRQRGRGAGHVRRSGPARHHRRCRRGSGGCGDGWDHPGDGEMVLAGPRSSARRRRRRRLPRCCTDPKGPRPNPIYWIIGHTSAPQVEVREVRHLDGGGRTRPARIRQTQEKDQRSLSQPTRRRRMPRSAWPLS